MIVVLVQHHLHQQLDPIHQPTTTDYQELNSTIIVSTSPTNVPVM